VDERWLAEVSAAARRGFELARASAPESTGPFVLQLFVLVPSPEHGPGRQ